MDKDQVIKIAVVGILGVAASGSVSAQEQSSTLTPPRPLAEICKATEEAEDGQGLPQDILDFLAELDRQGKILQCDSAYEAGDGSGPKPPEEQEKEDVM